MVATTSSSNVKGGAQLTLHMTALLITGSVIVQLQNTVLLPIAWIIHGVILVFLFAPSHETVHRTAFSSNLANQITGHMCGFMICLPYGFFRCFHLHHHRHTQDTENDPELQTAKPQNLRQYLWYMSGIPYWSGQTRTLFTHALGRVDEKYVFSNQRNSVCVEARVYLLLYGLIGLSMAASSQMAMWIIQLWLLPAVLAMPALRGFLLAEHTGCPHTKTMLKNSRTTLTNKWVRVLSWNMSFHAEHHADPATPFHALPGLHQEVHRDIAVVTAGYGAFHRELVGQLRGIAS
ncbi:MAG: fatty acid desaturase [Chromatiales bacterium]|jgi:fatty acid desaturase|nr:fatty acid desaturase [Chromatiales bacterium]